MITISVRGGGAAVFQALAERIDAAAEAGLKATTEMVEQEVTRQLTKIYEEPIPTRAQVRAFERGGRRPRREHIGLGGRGDKPAWLRTGHLYQGRTIAYEARGRATINITGPAAGYAPYRHGLGVPPPEGYIPKHPALGIIRRNEFMTDAVEEAAPRVKDVFEQALVAAFGEEAS